MRGAEIDKCGKQKAGAGTVSVVASYPPSRKTQFPPLTLALSQRERELLLKTA